MKRKFRFVFNEYISKQTLLNVAYVLFLLELLHIFALRIFKTYDYNAWDISEFLISYQGGFVRRGLIGEILFFFVRNFNINFELTVKIICVFFFSAVCLFFIKSFLNKGYSLYILPLCFFLGAGILGGSLIRKDYFLIFSLISVLEIYRKELPFILKYIIINIIFVFATLSHEVFAFISLPILLLLFFNHHKNKGVIQSAALSLVFLLPSLSAFLIVLIMHGNQETAQAIWNSWAAYLPLDKSRVSGLVSPLAWTKKFAFIYHLKANFLSVDRGVPSLLVWIIIFPVIYYISTYFLYIFRNNEENFTNLHKNALSSVIVFQLLCLLPLFTILSCDYIRLFFYWISSSFSIFLLIPEKDIEQLFPNIFISGIERMNEKMRNILQPSKKSLVFLMMIVGSSSANSEFEIDKVYTKTMMYNTLQFLLAPFLNWPDPLLALG